MGYLSFMVRNTENSDGCSAAVLERMVVDPRPRRRDAGAGTLSPWMDVHGEDGLPPLPEYLKANPGGSGTIILQNASASMWNCALHAGLWSFVNSAGLLFPANGSTQPFPSPT